MKISLGFNIKIKKKYNTCDNLALLKQKKKTK